VSGGQVADRPVRSWQEVHPGVDPLALVVRDRGEHGFAQGRGVERHRLADRRDQLDAVLGFQLVDVDDADVIHHAQMNGLPQLIPERGEVRASNGPEVQAGRDAVG
jgi:hypothetical protein